MIQTVDRFFAGSCDGNGNFTSTAILPAPALYAALRVVAQTTGTAARWTINVGGTAKAFSPGANVDIPILTQPNQSVIIQITGAAAFASVSGVLSGIGGGTLDEVAPFVSLVPNTITLNTLVSQQQIDSFTQAPNVVVANRFYLLPPGTQSVRVQVNDNAQVVTFTNYTVVGASTAITYVFPSANPGTSGGFENWFKPAPPDVAAGILFSLNTTGSANGVEVIITADLAMNFVEANLVGNGTASGSPILVENTTAAPWQAPNLPPQLINVTINAGANAVILAAAAGKIVYVFSCSIGIDAAVAGAITFQDTAGTTYHSFETSAPLVPNPLLGYGAPLPIGLGVRIANPLGGPVTVRGSLVASQA